LHINQTILVTFLNIKNFAIFISGIFFLFPSGSLLFLLFILYNNLFYRVPFNFSIAKLYQSVLIFFIFFPVILSTGFLTTLFIPFASKQDIVLKFASLSSSDKFISSISIVLVAPIIEEFYFRKILYTVLRENFNIFISIIFSSLYFGFVHQNIYAFPTLFILGIVLSLIIVLTKSWIYCVFGHSLFNVLMLLHIIYSHG
jgi:membrane protease YdiL (CAAX protease family)